MDVARVAPGVTFDSRLHHLLLRPVNLQKEPRLHWLTSKTKQFRLTFMHINTAVFSHALAFPLHEAYEVIGFWGETNGNTVLRDMLLQIQPEQKIQSYWEILLIIPFYETHDKLYVCSIRKVVAHLKKSWFGESLMSSTIKFLKGVSYAYLFY